MGANTPSLSTVGTVPAIAYKGQDLTPTVGVDSYQNENASAIEPGAAVARGTVITPTQPMNETCKLISATTDDFIGFAVRLPLAAAVSNATSFAQYDTVPIKKTGKMCVEVGENVTKGDNVMILTATPTVHGSSRNGVAGAGRMLATNWIYQDTVASGGVAIIENETHAGKTTT